LKEPEYRDVRQEKLGLDRARKKKERAEKKNERAKSRGELKKQDRTQDVTQHIVEISQISYCVSGTEEEVEEEDDEDYLMQSRAITVCQGQLLPLPPLTNQGIEQTINIIHTESGDHINTDPKASRDDYDHPQAQKANIEDVWMIENGKLHYDPSRNVCVDEAVNRALKMIRNLTLVERNERRKVQITGEGGSPVYAQGDFTDAEFHSEEHRLSTFTLKLKPSYDCLPVYCLPCPASEMF